MQTKLHLTWIGALALAVAAMTHAAEPRPALPSQATAPAAHLAVGQVVDFDSQQRLLTVAHQDIPSLGMPAMTMDFPVHASVDAVGISAGKTVALVLAPIEGKLTVTSLQAVGQDHGAAAPTTSASAMPGHPMDPGAGMAMMAQCHDMMRGR
ncbi:copper-binding protein [Azohydromonas australica]|uniref:copper-binding protein n=1 Tax=Azohydromonas australica TaxID=364039 RepID=UPI0004014085|nr:copper-binding protein [Azohydromonas australica]